MILHFPRGKNTSKVTHLKPLHAGIELIRPNERSSSLNYDNNVVGLLINGLTFIDSM